MTLEDDITCAFARACAEGDLEVAEFLLQALEAIAHRQGGDELPKGALDAILHIRSTAAVH